MTHCLYGYGYHSERLMGVGGRMGRVSGVTRTVGETATKYPVLPTDNVGM